MYIKDFQNKNVTCAWLNKIRCILNDCGMSYIWNMQNCISDKWLKLVVKHNLRDLPFNLKGGGGGGGGYGFLFRSEFFFWTTQELE